MILSLLVQGAMKLISRSEVTYFTEDIIIIIVYRYLEYLQSFHFVDI